jgi:hypothetical protein
VLRVDSAEGTGKRIRRTEDRVQRYEKKGDLGVLGKIRLIYTGFYAKQSQ